MGDEIPPQFSPDGRYWWDGEQWVPSEQLPRPLYQPVPAYPEWGDTGGNRSRLLLFGGIGLVLVLLIAGAGAAMASGLLHLPGRPYPWGGTGPTPSPALTATPTPTPARATTLPGLSPSTLIGLLQAQGLSCSPARPESFGFSWTCQGKKGDLDETVYFISADQQQVKGIRASATDNAPHPDPSHTAPFLGAIATIPYQGADPKKAQSWVTSHLTDQGAITQIGPVNLRTSRDANKPTWNLGMYPNTGS